MKRPREAQLFHWLAAARKDVPGEDEDGDGDGDGDDDEDADGAEMKTKMKPTTTNPLLCASLHWPQESLSPVATGRRPTGSPA